MNPRQAIALAIGTMLAIALVLSPRTGTPLHPVSRQVAPNGAITTVETSRPIFWQPPVFALVVLVTGIAIVRLRTPRNQP